VSARRPHPIHPTDPTRSTGPTGPVIDPSTPVLTTPATPATTVKGTPMTSQTPTRRRRGARVAAAVLGLSLLAAACGDDDADDASPETTEASTGDPASDDAPVVEVTAVDFAFEGLPSTIEAGTRLTLANDAPAELHEIVAIRLPDDETRTVEELMQLPESELGPLLESGPPALVILTPPGSDEIVAVGDGTLTEPGRYVVLCGIPTGVAPQDYLDAVEAAGGQKPEVEGGPPHFVHGMFADLTVE